jgi:hypothetical protein
MEDIQGVSGRRDWISRLNFLRSGILADDMACAPAACRTRHDGVENESRHTKCSHQTAMSRLLIRVAQQTQRVQLSRVRPAHVQTLGGMEERDLAYHWVTLLLRDKASQKLGTNHDRQTVTICRGGSSELNFFGM